MGAWGYESCSNDGVADALGFSILDRIGGVSLTDKVGFASVINDEILPGLKPHPHGRFPSVFLGVTIWGLRNGCRIKRPHLENALRDAREELTKLKESKDSAGWSDADKRKKALKKEIDEIRFACGNRKIGLKGPTPGIADAKRNKDSST